MPFCDLHTHSVYSDGTFTPAELVSEARKIGLSAIALTDHNTVAGLAEFISAAENSGVMAVPGVEFSTDYGNTELHILALFVRPEHYAPITSLLEEAAQRKEASNRRLANALRNAGYFLDYDVIKANTPRGQVNRAHFAAELTRLGYTRTRQEAFEKLLSPKCGFYVPPARIGSLEAIGFIKSLGAVSVLAHPFLSLDEKALREFLPMAVTAGLDAMETAYSQYSPETTALAEAIAAEYGLKCSGGSDFHGANKPQIPLGAPRIPIEWLEQLQKNPSR